MALTFDKSHFKRSSDSERLYRRCVEAFLHESLRRDTMRMRLVTSVMAVSMSALTACGTLTDAA